MKLLAMDFLHGYRFKIAKHEYLMSDLIIAALILAALPSLGSAIRELPSDITTANAEIRTTLPLFFHEMSNEGHLKEGDRVLVITRDNDGNIHDHHNLGNYNEIEFVPNKDMKRSSSLPNEYFDFVFTYDFSKDKDLIDRSLKVGGIVMHKYTEKENTGKFHSPSNYKVIYLRQFESTTIVAMQKLENTNSKRRLLGVQGKEEVLEKLEDVLLEPPRVRKSRKYLKKRTKYLADLLGDKLESYPRRVLIDVGSQEKTGANGDLGWFAKQYTKKNKDFEIYVIDTVAEAISSDDVVQVGMSDWLKRNVREEEYVVVKAEAEVVEEMVRNKALKLVDELFLECKYQGVKGYNRSRRAYWECLSLYGRLKDEGIVVHQWWG